MKHLMTHIKWCCDLEGVEGNTPNPSHIQVQLMVTALVISFTIIGMMATHSEQTALSRIEDRLEGRIR